MKMAKPILAELMGTFLLVFGGVSAAVIAGTEFGLLGVALAFGLSVMAGAYAFGPISGGHFNPAVTLGLTVAGKSCPKKVVPYIVSQCIGAVLGALAVYVLMMSQPTFSAAAGFASNGFGELSPYNFGLVSVIIAEIIVTFLFVTVILATTKKSFPPAMGGLVVGLTLTLLILVSGVISNASLNPARSLASAVFEGGLAMQQLWVFVVAPIAGGVLAGIADKMCCEDCQKSCTDGSCNV